MRDVGNTDGRSLKLAGRNTITFPKRERFNENSEDIIKEQRMANSTSKSKLGLASLNIAADAKSHYSKKSLTKSDLSQYFS